MWIPGELPLVAEMLEPPLDRRQVSAVVRLEGNRFEDPCHPIHVTGLSGRVERGLGLTMRLKPNPPPAG
jgi:hypothetical protein